MKTNVLKITSALFLFFVFTSCGNKNNSQKNDASQNDYTRLFSRSIENKDYTTAIMAAQMILLNDSTQLLYADTLPELYAAINNVDACSKSLDAAIIRNPNKERLLLIKALIAEQMQDVNTQLDIYNKLYAITQKADYLYRITAIQFGTGQQQEGEKNLMQLEKIAESKKDSVDFIISETEKQKVPLKAAVYNMYAFLFAQNKDMANAKKMWNLALTECPDFVIAKRNLAQISKGGSK